MYFWNYRLWKISSDHSVNSAVSEHTLTVNMWNCPKYFQYLYESLFKMCFNNFERSGLGKCLPYYYLKSYWCFFTHWLPNPSMLLKIGRICHSQFQCIYLKHEKLFLNFLLYFLKITVIPNLFPKLQTVNTFVRPLCENPCFETRFESQHLKLSKKLAKSPWENFFHVFSSFWEKLIWKVSPWLFREILRVSLNTLTTCLKYPVEDWENLALPIQMQFSEKRKNFSQFFLPFLESPSNLNILRKKTMLRANVFRKLQSVKIFVRQLCQKHRFGTRFDSQHLKKSQKLPKSPSEHFYHVFSSFWEKLIWKISPQLFREILGVFLNTLAAEGNYPIEDS